MVISPYLACHLHFNADFPPHDTSERPTWFPTPYHSSVFCSYGLLLLTTPVCPFYMSLHTDYGQHTFTSAYSLTRESDSSSFYRLSGEICTQCLQTVLSFVFSRCVKSRNNSVEIAIIH